MFDQDFYPTPIDVIEEMLNGETIAGKIILEPHAGKGDIVDYLLNHGVDTVLAAEKNFELMGILMQKCKVIGRDFLELTSDKISHIQMIVMNPPFSSQDQHILHAWQVAPPGCKIITLCNYDTWHDTRRKSRNTVRQLVDDYGSIIDMGMAFTVAEVKTDIRIGLIKMIKPGGSYENEFEGFFMFEEEERQVEGLMPYNFIRDIVNRYVEGVKVFDAQLRTAQSLYELLDNYFTVDFALMINERLSYSKRNDFKKGLQKAAWLYIFEKLDMKKYATQALREDINKFVEQQTEVPFTMRNIYHMLQIVVGTTTQRMDKALLEVFDQVTHHHFENRYMVEGWKSNSHYLITRKFILPNLTYDDPRYSLNRSMIQTNTFGNWDLVEDLLKALCYISGDEYNAFGALRDWTLYQYKVVTEGSVTFHHAKERYDGVDETTKALDQAGIKYTLIDHQPAYGEWYDWAYFRVKAYKKGSVHFEFKDVDLWGRFNQRIARLKGYPLFEYKAQTAYQRRQSGYAA